MAAPLGLHDEDVPSDNLSMPMGQFMRILHDPVRAPAETVEVDSFGDIQVREIQRV